MIYTTLFLIGVLGLLAQTLLGGAHGGHHAGHGGHGHSGHGHGGHHASGSHADAGTQRGPSPLWTLFSPLTLFSLCVGIGATGLLLRPLHWAALAVALAAAFGGLLFYGLIVRPVWGFIFRFASTPARALEGTVAQSAEALTRFDAQGKGLVRLNIDGQLVRVLAVLEPDERGETIAPGERLTVTAVNAHANTCRVTRLGEN